MKDNPKPHHYEMKHAFESGQTLQTIGDKYGISRERVRQILTLHFGFNARSGGVCIKKQLRANARKASRIARLDPVYLSKYGHSYSDHMKIKHLLGILYFTYPLDLTSLSRPDFAAIADGFRIAGAM